jgi:hypothetical protein
VIDLGTSAGLNLLLDVYSYCYPELGGRVFSSPFASEVDLEIEFSWRGRKPDEAREFFQVPNVKRRIGIDLAPIDLSILEHRQRYACFTPYLPAVIQGFLLLRDKVDFRLVAGDVITTLSPIARATSEDELLVLMHSFLWGQLTSEGREALSRELDALGAVRDLVVISIDDEGEGPEMLSRPVELRLRVYKQGRRCEVRLARCEHALDVGDWLEWLGPESPEDPIFDALRL